MRTVVVGKQKGGVGATTTTREIAVMAASEGRTVALVDLDPQRTLTRWWSRRQQGASAGDGTPNPALVGVEASAVPAALARLKQGGVDLVLIDTPPSIHPLVIELARCHADLVLAPVRPTTDDLDALRSFLDAVGPGVPLAFIITQAPTRSAQYDETLALLARRAPVAPPLRFRTGYSRAPSSGAAACEVVGSKESAEVGELWRWLEEMLASKSANHDARTLGRQRTRTP